MEQVINPFLTSGYKGKKYFCDREQETDRLSRTLMSGNNATLVSPRRLGKSALIHRVFEHIQEVEPDSKCFYIDIFATKNLEQMVQAMAKEIVGKLDKPSEKVLQQILEFFKAFRPKMSINTYSGAPEFSFDLNPTVARSSLDSVLDYLDQSGRRCYVAIDEFQQILNYSDTGTEAVIRSKIQFMRNVNFVFSGSQMTMMSEMFISPRHPFYNSTSIMSIGEIDKAKYLQFANGFFSAQQREISANDFGLLYHTVDGQTWYVQKLLSNLWYHHEAKIDRQLVMDSIDEALSEQEPTFLYIYNMLSENQAALLQAIAQEQAVASPYSSELAKKYHLPAQSSIKRSIESLEKAQLIYRDYKDKAYKVSDRFMSLWLRRQY